MSTFKNKPKLIENGSDVDLRHTMYSNHFEPVSGRFRHILRRKLAHVDEKLNPNLLRAFSNHVSHAFVKTCVMMKH